MLALSDFFASCLDEHCKRYGRGSDTNYLFVSAFFWRVRAGVPWQHLPERLDKRNLFSQLLRPLGEKNSGEGGLFSALAVPAKRKTSAAVAPSKGVRQRRAGLRRRPKALFAHQSEGKRYVVCGGTQAGHVRADGQLAE